jgi:hypothetical protein
MEQRSSNETISWILHKTIFSCSVEEHKYMKRNALIFQKNTKYLFRESVLIISCVIYFLQI